MITITTTTKVIMRAYRPAYRFLRRQVRWSGTQVKKQQLELDVEQKTGSKSGKEYIKVVFYYPAYLTYMQNTSCEMPGWMKPGIRIIGRNINNLSYTDDTTLMVESEEELKSLLMKVKDKSEKFGLKLNVQKTNIMVSGPITSWQIDKEQLQQ